MSILTLIALTALAIILTLLLAPVRVRFRVDAERQFAACGYLGFGIRIGNPNQRWVLSFLGLKLLSGSLVIPARKKPVDPGKKDKAAKRSVAFGDLWGLLIEHWPVLRRTLYLVFRLVGRLLRSWRLEEGHLALNFGVGDPGGTGILTGYLYAIQGWLRQIRPSLDIRIHPNFDQRILRLNGALTLRIIPLIPVRHFIQTFGAIPWRGLWKLKRAWAAH